MDIQRQQKRLTTLLVRRTVVKIHQLDDTDADVVPTPQAVIPTVTRPVPEVRARSRPSYDAVETLEVLVLVSSSDNDLLTWLTRVVCRAGIDTSRRRNWVPGDDRRIPSAGYRRRNEHMDSTEVDRRQREGRDNLRGVGD